MAYAERTVVSVALSKAEIEDLLLRYGATGFMTGWNDTSAAIGFQMHGKSIRFLLPLPRREDFAQRKDQWGRNVKRSPEAALKLYEQACRTKWRALALCIKAKLEAVTSGITTFEHEFLAHFTMPNGQTIGDVLIPQIEKISSRGEMPPLMLGMDL